MGHHQVCLEVNSYNVHAVKGGGPRSRNVGSYIWIALGNYGIEISLILWFHEVSRASVL